MGSGSHKVQDNLPAISNKIEIISSTLLVLSKNSTDLDSGRRPELKSVEFFESTKRVDEIQSLGIRLFTKTCGTLWEPDPVELVDRPAVAWARVR